MTTYQAAPWEINPNAWDTVDQGGCVDQSDRDLFDQGCHYNYVTQTWHDGHDHAHYLMHPEGPLVFCGADVQTCQG